MTTLVDSSVLLDVLAPSPWRQWSEQQLQAAADRGQVAINQIVYAEIAVGFSARDGLERALRAAGLSRLALPWAAAWLVARAFVDYRKRGGARTTPLPDFFIGAHAQAAGLALLTRDSQRVRTYFPAVELIAPDDPPPRHAKS
ncbi:MAG: type II toxin-antitoxin system VapC family toxin [Solirubrobacteraceae bacterium]